MIVLFCFVVICGVSGCDCLAVAGFVFWWLVAVVIAVWVLLEFC